jgi:hypothetical protein
MLVSSLNAVYPYVSHSPRPVRCETAQALFAYCVPDVARHLVRAIVRWDLASITVVAGTLLRLWSLASFDTYLGYRIAREVALAFRR